MSASSPGPVALPRHVAIIMDGNGRWAKQRGLPRIAGHKQGVEAVRRAVDAAGALGIEALTLYAFSTENWRRPEEEVTDLLGLLRLFIVRELDALHKAGVRIRVLGELDRFPKDIITEIDKAVARTADNRKMTLAIALGYGSRAEIAAAARTLAARAARGELDPAQIDEAMIERELYTHDMPPLDLLIRTSGEVRLSNFLLWQAAYAEMIFIDQLWPDFDQATLSACLDEFARRERRYGGL